MATKDPSPVIVSNTKAIPVTISNNTPTIAAPLVQQMIESLTRIRYALFSLTVLSAILLAHLYLSRYSFERAILCGIPDETFDLTVEAKKEEKEHERKCDEQSAHKRSIHRKKLDVKRLEARYVNGADHMVKIPLIEISVHRHDLNPIGSGLLAALLAWIMISLRQLHATISDKTLGKKLKPYFPLLRYQLGSIMSQPAMTLASIVQIVILILPVFVLGIVTLDGLHCVMSPGNNAHLHQSEWANSGVVIAATTIVFWMTQSVFKLGFSLLTTLSDKPPVKSP